jgi:thiamine biosynthesis lipoprotein
MSETTLLARWSKHTFAAMGTNVTVSARSAPDSLNCEAEALFNRVEGSCSRFDPTSDLSRVNRAPDVEHHVAPECAQIIDAAYRAYVVTDTLFDPRVLTSLVRAGYDRTFDDIDVGLVDTLAPVAEATAHTAWHPRVDLGTGTVQVGSHPIDLGGIGKGWTVDVAAATVGAGVTDCLINAGGDLVVRGDGPTEDGWTVGIEDPNDATVTAAVLRLHDAACATSSTTKRAWRRGHDVQHHLIDPRTGTPATGGIASVTVVAGSAVEAETWSKALLIAGQAEIDDLTAARGIAAFWILDDGRARHSDAMSSCIAWQRG